MIPSRTEFLCALSLWCVLCTKSSHLLVETFCSNSRKLNICSSIEYGTANTKAKVHFSGRTVCTFLLRRTHFLSNLNFRCEYENNQIWSLLMISNSDRFTTSPHMPYEWYTALFFMACVWRGTAKHRPSNEKQPSIFMLCTCQTCTVSSCATVQATVFFST